MSDGVLQSLAQQLEQSTVPALWVADESNLTILDTLAKAAAPLTVISNRYDLTQAAEARGLTAHFSDFDFSETRGVGPRAFYRISKERPVVNHVINSIYRQLPTDGELWLAGRKNEGIKTSFAQAAKLFGCSSRLKKVGNDYLGKLTKNLSDNPLLNDQDYTQLRWIEPRENDGFFSKPGTYGWNKVDKGSAFLIEHTRSMLRSFDTRNAHLLDLGCGYGYLTIQCREQTFASVTGTDNNAAAINCARANMAHYGIDARIVADDCGGNLTGPYDLILCNPPFHQGFSVESSLSEKFLKAVRRLLGRGARAYLVVNSFIPLETKAKKLFAPTDHSVEVVANNGQFKVIQITAA